MIVGIDASNIRVGGGVTHLVEMLRAAEPAKFGFTRVIVWAGRKTLSRIEEREEWLEKVHVQELDGNLPKRIQWQRYSLSTLASRMKCDLLFVPGGNYSGDFHPVVSMSQNLLPFEWRELKRYGVTWMMLKMVLLRFLQSKTFAGSNGVIFLTKYAKDTVMRVVEQCKGSSEIIPLGINDRFFASPNEDKLNASYSKERPCRLLYVSVIDVYKHQWHVVEAVADLRKRGYPVTLELAGAAVGNALSRLEESLRLADPSGEFIRYLGPVPHEELDGLYKSCDINVFASSCENMPNILLEAMASSIPVACSRLGPMTEVLGDAGVYFDPEKSSEIASAIGHLFSSPSLRMANAKKANTLAKAYSWTRCANESFSYFSDVIAASKVAGIKNS